MKLSGIEMVKSVEVEIIEKGSRFEIKLEKEQLKSFEEGRYQINVSFKDDQHSIYQEIAFYLNIIANSDN